MSGLKSRAHLIRKYTYPTSLISSSLTQLGALYVQKGFFPTWRRSSTQPAQVSIAAVRFAPICSWTCIFVIVFLSLHFLPVCWPIFVMPSWFASQTFAMESFWSSLEQFFQDHRCWKQRMIYIFATYGLCVWGQPLFRRAFITCPIFSYSSQFTGRGTRHPWPTVCNEATVLDGISGLITLTYLQLVTMFFHYPSFLMTFRLLFFNICMNNSRNRSPLRIFPYLPISATFVQCGQRRPSWTKHVNSRISSGALLGMKRLIDEMRSFKCV